MKLYSLSLIILFFLLAGCSEKQELKKENKTAIIGLASPIRLAHDAKSIRIEDYFLDDKKISKATLGGVALNTSETGELLIPNNGISKASLVNNLNVVYDGQSYDIPVFLSEKVNYTFTYLGGKNAQEVGIAGSMNGWNYKNSLLQRAEEGWTISFVLNPGMHEYRIWVDGKEQLDENNPMTKDNGMGALNNFFLIGNPDEKVPLIKTSKYSSEGVEILAPENLTLFAYLNNSLIAIQRKGEKCTIPLSASEEGVLRVFGGTASKRSNDLYIPIKNGKPIEALSEISRKDFHKSIMYFMMVDRFANGNQANDRPTNDPAILPQANNLGGDIEGIIEKIKSGYFENLGINTIWVSPISRNAEGAWGLWNKGVESKFSAYHGYWPTALTKIDDRFGSEASFKELLEIAHEKNMNVILDYVAHHVHQEHPLIKAKPDWTTPLYLPDGTMNTEKWDEHRLTTWFDTFLPTWDFSKKEVVEALTDSAMYWVDNYDLDGFRHDATKHIPEAFWQTLTSKIKQRQNKQLFQIGETYGSPELIGSYVNSGQLDAQFDFNLYDAMVDAFAKDESSFQHLAFKLEESLYQYGSHHLMGTITGNQDRARFISYADGSIAFSEDPKLAGWTRKIENKSIDGFKKLEMLNAFMLFAPGIPCIYYGDEIGMPGGNDPDNRRMMIFEGWNENQTRLFESTKRLVELRKTNPALVYGDTRVLYKDDKCLVIERSYFGKTVVLVLAKGQRVSSVSFSVEGNTDLQGLKRFHPENEIIIEGNRITIPVNSKVLDSKGYQLLY